ncbi:hypothetical protein KKF47_03455, partial [Patescibacteria group bacterium]|nr:hypothetical protein [Patescibacteria group bacterium]
MTNFKKYAVRRNKQELEPQEVFLDSLAQKRQEKANMKELKFEVPPSKNALNGLLIFSLFILLVLLGKTLQLNIIKGKDLAALAEKNASRTTPIRANRGIIYDQFYKKLVSNLPSFDLVLDKRDLLKDEVQRARE